jgi:guanidinobutyrase
LDYEQFKNGYSINGLDPTFALGTVEIRGLTAIQGLKIIRRTKGLNIIGGNLVEVSLPH